ncbi:MAG: superoxide dismutase [Cyanobium sp.]|nr:superoxide dismutase [Cyanobium sp.]
MLGWLLLLLVAAAPAQAAFELPPLPYPADALEPAIDARTMEIHHDRHHAGYVAQLNAALSERDDLAGLSLEQLLARARQLPDAVRKNAGGHWNHSQFWTAMAPPGGGGAPSEELLAAIDAGFGSLEAFQQRFSQVAAGRFGSGWAWLILRPDGTLAVTSTANQDNPLMNLPGIERGTPLLGLDVWEHAYYLAYQNRRADYIASWWSLVDWTQVSQRYADTLRPAGATSTAFSPRTPGA